MTIAVTRTTLLAMGCYVTGTDALNRRLDHQLGWRRQQPSSSTARNDSTGRVSPGWNRPPPDAPTRHPPELASPGIRTDLGGR